MKLLIAVLFVGNFLASSADADSNRSRERLQQLLIWKVSDSLNLTSKEESKLTSAIETTAKEKQEAGLEMQKIIQKLKAKKKNATALLEDYENALAKYHKAQEAELKRISKALGSERAAKYLVIKNEFGDKLKSVLSQINTPEEKPKPKKLKDPQIIEE